MWLFDGANYCFSCIAKVAASLVSGSRAIDKAGAVERHFLGSTLDLHLANSSPCVLRVPLHEENDLNWGLLAVLYLVG